MSDYLHRIITKQPELVIARLHEHGIVARRASVFESRYGGCPVDFHGPRDLNLDFLRPDILPPK